MQAVCAKLGCSQMTDTRKNDHFFMMIVYQTDIGTVSKATLGKLLRDGVERIWAFPSA